MKVASLTTNPELLGFQRRAHRLQPTYLQTKESCYTTALQKEMLKLVHQPHLGTDVSKRQVRKLLCWPEMEQLVKS